MSSSFKLDNAQVKASIEKVQAFLQSQNLDGIYISSYDQFINEYVPMSNCHRYFVTGFSGSTAESFVPREGKVRLYVDGRYHEQADLECDLDLVDVVKVPHGEGLKPSLGNDIKKLNYNKIACEGERIPVHFYKYLNKNFDLTVLEGDALSSVFTSNIELKLSPIKQLDLDLCGKSVLEKLNDINEDDKSAFYITAVDSLSWITNCRGYHLPNLSSFLGKGIAVKDKVFVFTLDGVDIECRDEHVEFVRYSPEVLSQSLKKIVSYYKIEKILVDEQMLNASDYILLSNIMGEESVIHKDEGLASYHAIKNEGEIKAIKESFRRGDKAIFNTISWVKEMLAKGENVSEKDIYLKTTEKYQEQGAVEQSFNTIAGIDANGSIIHYGDPKTNVFATEESMILLDSGGYFDGGYATDTTRTFMASDKEGSDKHRRIYTLVLKGILNVQNAVFKSATKSGGLDAICRQPLHQEGYDYAHGTGHGVGIHVHEGGTSISGRNHTLKPGHVVSLEPGIYIPGFGGVRLENIALVIDHPRYEGMMKFEPLVYIGFEPKLIDESMLNAQEKIWLDEYEAECVKRGTSFLLNM